MLIYSFASLSTLESNKQETWVDNPCMYKVTDSPVYLDELYTCSEAID